ncbi:MAG: CHAT domain-containing protein [Colwellia sp.]|jgi:CHAT domain-containing protein
MINGIFKLLRNIIKLRKTSSKGIERSVESSNDEVFSRKSITREMALSMPRLDFDITLSDDDDDDLIFNEFNHTELGEISLEDESDLFSKDINDFDFMDELEEIERSQGYKFNKEELKEIKLIQSEEYNSAYDELEESDMNLVDGITQVELEEIELSLLDGFTPNELEKIELNFVDELTSIELEEMTLIMTEELQLNNLLSEGKSSSSLEYKSTIFSNEQMFLDMVEEIELSLDTGLVSYKSDEIIPCLEEKVILEGKNVLTPEQLKEVTLWKDKIETKEPIYGINCKHSIEALFPFIFNKYLSKDEFHFIETYREKYWVLAEKYISIEKNIVEFRGNELEKQRKIYNLAIFLLNDGFNECRASHYNNEFPSVFLEKKIMLRLLLSDKNHNFSLKARLEIELSVAKLMVELSYNNTGDSEYFSSLFNAIFNLGNLSLNDKYIHSNDYSILVKKQLIIVDAFNKVGRISEAKKLSSHIVTKTNDELDYRFKVTSRMFKHSIKNTITSDSNNLLSQFEIETLLEDQDYSGEFDIREREESTDYYGNPEDDVLIENFLQRIELSGTLFIHERTDSFNFNYIFSIFNLIDYFDNDSNKICLLNKMCSNVLIFLNNLSQFKRLKIKHFIYESSIELVDRLVLILIKNAHLIRERTNYLTSIKKMYTIVSLVVGQEHTGLIELLVNIALLYSKIGQDQKSLVLLLRAYNNAKLKNTGDTIFHIQFYLADAYNLIGEEKISVHLYQKCLYKNINSREKSDFGMAVRNNLGYSNLNLGDLNNAFVNFKECFKISLKQRGIKHESTLLYLNNLLKCYLKNGHIKIALDLYKKHYFLCEKELGHDHEITCISKLNLADCYYKTGEFEDALTNYQDCYSLSLKLFGEQGKFFLRNVDGLANCFHSQGDIERAAGIYVDNYQQSMGKYGDYHHHTIKSLISLVDYYSNCSGLEYIPALIIRFDQKIKRLLNSLAEIIVRNKNWVVDVNYCLETISNNAHLLNLKSGDWSFYKISEIFQEELDLVSDNTRKRLVPSFTRIHEIWLSIAITQTPEQIPTILSAVQGRNMTAIWLTQLEERKASFANRDSRNDYLRLVLDIRTLKLELELNKEARSLSSSSIEKSGSTSGSLYDKKVMLLSQWMKERKLLEKKLSRSYPDFSIMCRKNSTTPESLSEKCKKNEAIVLFFDTEEVKTETSFQKKKQDYKGINILHLCVIYQGKVELVKRVKLDTSVECINRYQTYHNKLYRFQRRGLRDCIQDDESTRLYDDSIEKTRLEDIPTLLCEQLDNLDGQFKSYFWKPLIELLPEVRHWHVITHGSKLHSLPLHNTVPESNYLHCYPGILFYCQRRYYDDVATDRSIKPKGIAVHSDDAIGTHRPIPFVNAEMNIINSIIQSRSFTHAGVVEGLWKYSSAKSFDSWHFSCHGQLNNQDPVQTILVLDAKHKKTLGMSQLIDSPQRPRVVVLSACVVGQVHHMDGEPIGVNAGFQLRGSDYVIAPTQPVSDFYMPLFMALFYQAWLELENPENALIEAKKRLSSGQWYDNTADLVHNAYVPVINKLLKEEVLNEKTLQGDPLKVAEGWFLSQDLQQRFSKLQGRDFKGLEKESYRIALSKEVVGHLITQRANLPEHEVRHLCTWIKGFGQVRGIKPT